MDDGGDGQAPGCTYRGEEQSYPKGEEQQPQVYRKARKGMGQVGNVNPDSGDYCPHNAETGIQTLHLNISWVPIRRRNGRDSTAGSSG